MADLSFNWLTGAIGTGVFLLLSWVLGTYLNWRVNNSVRVELKGVNDRLDKVIRVLDESNRNL